MIQSFIVRVFVELSRRCGDSAVPEMFGRGPDLDLIKQAEQEDPTRRLAIAAPGTPRRTAGTGRMTQQSGIASTRFNNRNLGERFAVDSLYLQQPSGILIN